MSQSGVPGHSPLLSPIHCHVWNRRQFSRDISPAACGAFFPAWSSCKYLSPATQELWQSQAWPREFFTMDFCSSDSTLLTQIICTVLSLIYWLGAFPCVSTNSSAYCLSCSWWSSRSPTKRTGLFPSPPVSSHQPGATGRCWDTATYRRGNPSLKWSAL